MSVTAYYPTPDDVPATAPDPVPDFIRFDGYNAPGDAGAALYAKFAAELIPDGDFSIGVSEEWTLENWVWDGTVGGGYIRRSAYPNSATRAVPLVAGREYLFTFQISGQNAGNWFAYAFNLSSSIGRQVGTGASADGNIRFTAQPGENAIRIGSSPSFDGRLNDVSVKEVLEEGQREFWGNTYRLLPLNGLLRPEMFGAGLGLGATEQDQLDFNDEAFSKLVRRVATLFVPNPGIGELSVHLEMAGRYAHQDVGHVILVPEGRSLTIDGKGPGCIDLSAAPYNIKKAWLTVYGPGYSGVRTRLAAEAQANELSFSVVTTEGFGHGDWVAVTSEWEYFGGVDDLDGFGINNIGELVQIRNVTSNTDINIGSRLSFGYKLSGGNVNIRRFGMAHNFKLSNLRFFGPGHGEVNDGNSTYALEVRYFETITEDHVTCENFRGQSISYRICANVVLDTPRTTGIKYQDVTNATGSKYFYGRTVAGCSRGAISSPIGEYCRRAIDLHETASTEFASDVANAREGVIATNIVIDGGYTIASQNPPTGHKSYNVILANHLAFNVTGGFIRGKNWKVVNCVIECTESSALGLGHLDARDVTGNPAIPEEIDPNAGTIEVINCTLISRGSTDQCGVAANTSIDKLVVRGCRIRAPWPVRTFGNKQSNVFIEDCDIECTLPTNDINYGPAIAAINDAMREGSNWHIRRNRIKGGTVGFRHDGCKVATVANLKFEDNDLEALTSHVVSLSRAGGNQWATDGSLEATSNMIVGVAPSGFLDIGPLFFVAYGNSFGDNAMNVTLSSQTITLPEATRAQMVRCRISFSAASTLATINGARDGQFVLLYLAENGNSLTVSETGNIRLTGSQTLDNSQDRLLLFAAGGYFYQIAFANNA